MRSAMEHVQTIAGCTDRECFAYLEGDGSSGKLSGPGCDNCRGVITAARLEVVARLREMAEHIYVDEADEAQWYQARTLNSAADELDAEIRDAVK